MFVPSSMFAILTSSTSQEYHNNPSNIGGRGYTPYAQWKFREFNELPHLFKRRLNESYETASMYIGQFPNEKIALLARYISFLPSLKARIYSLLFLDLSHSLPVPSLPSSR